MNLKLLFCFFVTLPSISFGKPVYSQPSVSISNDTGEIINQSIELGKVKVLVSYRPYRREGNSRDSSNLRYQILYNNRLFLEKGETTLYRGGVTLQDLNGDRESEVIIETYSGGAHCCTNFKVYSWQQSQFIKTEFSMLDGLGGKFRDLDDDGTIEFLSVDNSFLYAFSSYAESFPPSKIFEYRQGKFYDRTVKFTSELRHRLNLMYSRFLEEKDREGGNINGILAGYVAQKILLGEYEQGWRFMEANYDRSQDWGLDQYSGTKKVGRYKKFPDALRAHLIQNNYLDSRNKPAFEVSN